MSPSLPKNPASTDADSEQRNSIYLWHGREVKAKAHLAFLAYHAHVSAGEMDLAQAALERYLDASHVLRTGAPR